MTGHASNDPAETIDVGQLQTMTMGDAELAAEALGIFRNQADLWGKMLDPLTDSERWADACHAIKGAARSIGAMQLGDACEIAETLGRTPAVSRAQASVALSDVKDRLGDAIEAAAALEHRLVLTQAFPARSG